MRENRPRLSAVALALAGLALAVLPARAEVPAPASAAGTVVVREWLALDAVDERARVPFNASAPFFRYLLDRGAASPKAGEVVKGGKGEAAWRAVAASEDGTVEDEKGSWFFAEVEAPKEPAEKVHLAHLDGASTLFVNGAGFVGDVYRGGFGPVPVALRAGTNRLFVAGTRGPWSLRFEPWTEGRSPILAEDATLPDAVEGALLSDAAAARRINPSTAWAPEPWIEIQGNDGPPDPPPPDGWRPGMLAPLWTGKVGFDVFAGRRGGIGNGGVGIRLQACSATGKAVGPPVPIRIEVRKPGEARRVTFISDIDGSVQHYALLPPKKSNLPPPMAATVLTLHGAGVDALGQARAYSPKTDFRIVAPTNRRPFGFDWQDWGRIDALEALDHALRSSGGDPGRVYLTGHSMGGHGVWHLAANDPDRWSGIAPSAGWCSFDTYGGGPRPTTPLTPIWRACDGGSRTEDLIANLAGIPTFVLHGTKDDNVPLSEATAMIERIEKAGGKPLHHFQEGAGHWWDGDASPGVDCVDFPGIFEMFRERDATAPAKRERSSPYLSGPFKRAFERRFVLVVGSKGTEEENREMLELARWHAATWWYRANGSAPLVRDADLLADPRAFDGRNLILYGNADVNAAWNAVLREGCPVVVRRGELRLGERSWKGDSLGAVFVQPRPAGDALVGAFASTGPHGTRLAYGLLPFTSGVGYPDYCVFGEEFLRSGDGGVLAAGWFDHAWGLQPGGFMRE